eukprot:NODE_14317_length_1116_cov_2.904954.p2 GENE.NODE_14317_length_1116_cov_2.904954~~NODE_14317_length_1116_cov_2.904954.p2  ORF type:complete len:135 (-),score=9.47 NODE_14317_length_1116_cov_2.904954:182-586(-)
MNVSAESAASTDAAKVEAAAGLPSSNFISVPADFPGDSRSIGFNFAAGANAGLIIVISITLKMTFVGAATCLSRMRGRCAAENVVLLAGSRTGSSSSSHYVLIAGSRIGSSSSSSRTSCLHVSLHADDSSKLLT